MKNGLSKFISILVVFAFIFSSIPQGSFVALAAPDDSPQETATVTDTPEPTASPVHTPDPTSSPAPSASIIPEPTETPEATLTPMPSPTETVQPEETLSPEIDGSTSVDPLMDIAGTEDVSKRSTYLNNYILENGLREYEIYSEPVNYKDSNGKYQPIDNSLQLVTDIDGKQKFKNKANDFGVLIGTDTTNDWNVDMSKGKYSIGWKLIGNFNKKSGMQRNKLSTDQWKKQREGQKRHSIPNLSSEVNFAGVLSNIDLQYHLESNYIKQNLVMNTYTEIPTLSEKIKLKGLNAVSQEDGSIVFVDSKTSDQIFVMPAPCMFDSQGNPGNITASITQKGNSCTLVYTLDTAWLKTAIYPVTIDPTVTVPNGATQMEDTKLVEAYPNSNYYTQTSFATGYTTSGHRLYSLVKFNYLPALNGNQIYKAIFSAITDMNSNASTVGVCEVTGSWTSSSVTWNSRPQLYPTKEAPTLFNPQNVPGTSGATCKWDITDIAKYWYLTNNYGLLLKTDNDTGAYMLWYSSDASSNHPMLTISYDATAPIAPTSLSTNPVASSSWKHNATPTISWSGITDDGGSELLKAKYFVYKRPPMYVLNGQSTLIVSGDIPTGNGVASGSYTLPNPLSSGIYDISIAGVDGVGNQGGVSTVTYQLDISNPSTPVSITSSPVASSAWTDKNAPTISWSGISDAGGSELDHVEYQIDSTTGTWTSIDPSDGTASGSAPIDIDTSGSHTVYLRGVDGAGNGGAPASIIYKLDSNAPSEPSLSTNPSATTDWTNNSAATLYWNGINDTESGLNKVQYKIGEDGTWTDIPNSASAAGSYSLPSFNESGVYTIFVRGIDNMGNEGENASIVYQLDMESPHSIDSLTADVSDGALNGGDSASITLSYEAAIDNPDEDSSGIKEYEIEEQLNSGEYAAVGRTSETSYVINSQPDNSHFTFRIRAWDNAGNCSAWTESNTATSADRTPPSIPSSLTVSPSDWTRSITPTLTWSGITDGAGNFDRVQYSLMLGTQAIVDWTTADCPVGSSSIVVDLTKADISVLNSGDYTFYLRGMDIAGNTGDAATVSYKMDFTRPTVSITSPTNNEYVNNIVDIRGSISYTRPTSWTLEYGAGTSPSVYYTIAYGNGNIPDNSVIYTWDTSSLLTNQVYTIRLKADAGQEYSSSVTKTIIKGADPDSIIGRTLQVDSPHTYYNSSAQYLAESQTTVDTSDAFFTYERANDGGNQDLQGTLYVNGQKAGEETQPGQGFNINMLSYPEGTDNEYFIVSNDSSENTYYSCRTQCDRALNDTLIDPSNFETLSNVVIENGMMKLVTDGSDYVSTGYFITKSIPVYSSSYFQLYLSNTVDLPNSTSIEYFYSIDNGLTWLSFEPDRTILNNLNSVKVKGVLSTQAPSSTPSIDTVSVNILYFLNPTKIALHIVDAPKDLQAVSNVNHTILIKWQASDTVGATYNVYRSTSQDGEYTAVATGLTQTYWYDYNLVYGQTFYYQVKAQAIFGGQPREDGWGLSKVSGTVVNEVDIEKMIGSQPYSTFDGNINVVSGNLYYQVTDLSDYTPGSLSLDMVRTYNSQATYNTALGYGWDFSFNICLLKEYDPTYQGANPPEIGMILKEGDGTLYRFLKTEQNTYTSPAGTYMVLSCNNGAYQIATKDKTTFYFDNDLLINRITDSNGNTIIFEHDMETGNLSKISDNIGNSIWFDYDGNSHGKLVGIHDRNISIDYVSSGSNGISKVELNGDRGLLKETYSENELGKLCGISDAAGNTTTIEYLNGKVSKLTNPIGEAKTFLYNVDIDGDTNNTVSTFCNATAASTTYHYNEGGLITKLTNPLGVDTEYQHDENYNVTQTKYKNRVGTTDNVDIITSAAFNANGNMLHSTNEYGFTSYYLDYNTFGEAGTIIQPFTDNNNNGVADTYVKQTFAYDPITGNLLSSSKKCKGTYSNGSFSQIGNAVGMETRYTYDGFGNVLSESTGLDLDNSNATKSVTSYTYDAQGRLLSTTAPDGSITGQHYNDAGYVDWTSDEEGAKTYYYYDSYGRKASTINPGQDATIVLDDISESYTYDKCGNIVRVDSSYMKNLSVHDDITLDKFDALGRNTSTTTAAGTLDASRTQTVYSSPNSQGNYTVTNTDAEGVATTTTYNSEGWVLRAACGDKWMQTQYDYCGQAIRTETNDGIVNVTQYDKLVSGRIVKWNKSISDFGDSTHKNQTTETGYDLMGNIIMSKDPTNIVTETTYDATDRTLEVKKTNPNTTPETVNRMGYVYDISVDGKYETILTDTLGREKDYYYDTIGNLEKLEDKGDSNTSAEMVTEYTYYDNGSLHTEKRPDNTVITYEYYDDESLSRVKYSSSFYIDYTYDGAGNELSMTQTKDGVVTTKSWEYDNQDRVKLIKQDGVTIIKYDYDDNGNITKMGYPQSDGTYKVIGYAYDYDNGGRLMSISDISDIQHSKLIRKYIYNSDGKLESLRDYKKFSQALSSFDYSEQSFTYYDDSSVHTVTYTDKRFDSNENLISSLVKESYTLDYNDATGNIKEEDITTNYGTSAITTIKGYEYDAFGRLWKEKVNGTTTVTYEFDNVGNRKKLTTGSSTIYYDYNEFDELTRTASDQNFTNLINSYTYDGRGNQTTVTDVATSTLTTNNYDAADRLSSVTKRVGQGSTVTVASYCYDGSGQRISKQVGAGTTRYYYDDSLNLLFTDDGTAQRLEENLMEPDGSIFASKRFTGNYAGNCYFYRQDIRGSITSVVDKDGSRVVGQAYDAYGNTTRTGDQNFTPSCTYTGAVNDYETGLYYMNARYYSSESGSFLTRDSYQGDSSELQPWQAYGYCSQNPISCVDKTGHTPTAPTLLRGSWDMTRIKGIAYYCQGNYSHDKFGQLKPWTIKANGCGLCCMSMVASTYEFVFYPPWYITSLKLWPKKGGVQYNCLPYFQAICQYFGYKIIGDAYITNHDKVISYLKQGYLVIKDEWHIVADKDTGEPVSHGHFVLLSYAKDHGVDKYFLYDPGYSNQNGVEIGNNGDDLHNTKKVIHNVTYWQGGGVFWHVKGGFYVIQPSYTSMLGRWWYWFDK